MQTQITSGIDRAALQSIAERANALLVQMAQTALEAGELVQSVQSLEALSMEDQWARTWGETLNMTEAAKMLGIGYTKLRECVIKGSILTTPDGRVIVREACKWAYGRGKDGLSQASPPPSRMKTTPVKVKFAP